MLIHLLGVLLQYLLQRAHFFKFPFESTFVAHQGDFPLSRTHPLLYLFPRYMKEDLQFKAVPRLL